MGLAEWRAGTSGAGRPRWGGAVALAAVALAALGLHALTKQSVGDVRQRDRAALALAQASRAILTTPYAILSLLEFDDNTEAGREAPVLFLDAVRDAKRALDAAARLAPDKAASVAAFRDRFERLAEKAEAPLAIGNAAPGLTKGSDLSAAELAALAAGAKSAAEASIEFQALDLDMRSFAAAFALERQETAEAQTARSDAAVICLAAATLAGLFLSWESGRRTILRRLRLRRDARREMRALEALYVEAGAPTAQERGPLLGRERPLPATPA